MKDEYLLARRIAFALVMLCIIGAYVVVLGSPLKGELTEKYQNYILLEQEKANISAYMVDPERVAGAMEDMRDQLAEMRRAEGLTPATVMAYLTDNLNQMGAILESIVIEAPEPPGGSAAGGSLADSGSPAGVTAVAEGSTADGSTAGGTTEASESSAGGERLQALPIHIRCKATYDGGMYFIAVLENSETGAFRIDAFSFNAAGEAAAGGIPDDGTTGGGVPGGSISGGGAAADGSAGESAAYSLLDWEISIRLLYYGES
jgi:hypothetical protein